MPICGHLQTGDHEALLFGYECAAGDIWWKSCKHMLLALASFQS